jgi:hypothetical protein
LLQVACRPAVRQNGGAELPPAMIFFHLAPRCSRNSEIHVFQDKL